MKSTECDAFRADSGKVYRKRGELVCREIGGETVVVPVAGKLADLDKVYCMEPVARFIFDLIDGEKALSAIRAAVLAEYEVTPEEAERDLLEFVGQLREAGLIEEVG